MPDASLTITVPLCETHPEKPAVVDGKCGRCAGREMKRAMTAALRLQEDA